MEKKWPLPDALQLPLYFQADWGESFRVIKIVDPGTQLIVSVLKDPIDPGRYLYSLSREELTQSSYFHLLQNYSLSNKENFINGLIRLKNTHEKALQTLEKQI